MLIGNRRTGVGVRVPGLAVSNSDWTCRSEKASSSQGSRAAAPASRHGFLGLALWFVLNVSPPFSCAAPLPDDGFSSRDSLVFSPSREKRRESMLFSGDQQLSMTYLPASQVPTVGPCQVATVGQGRSGHRSLYSGLYGAVFIGQDRASLARLAGGQGKVRKRNDEHQAEHGGFDRVAKHGGAAAMT